MNTQRSLPEETAVEPWTAADPEDRASPSPAGNQREPQKSLSDLDPRFDVIVPEWLSTEMDPLDAACLERALHRSGAKHRLWKFQTEPVDGAPAATSLLYLTGTTVECTSGRQEFVRSHNIWHVVDENGKKTEIHPDKVINAGVDTIHYGLWTTPTTDPPHDTGVESWAHDFLGKDASAKNDLAEKTRATENDGKNEPGSRIPNVATGRERDRYTRVPSDVAPADPWSDLRPRQHMLVASRAPRPGPADFTELLNLVLTYGEGTSNSHDPREPARHRAWLAGLLMPPTDARRETLEGLIAEHAELFSGPLAAETDYIVNITGGGPPRPRAEDGARCGGPAPNPMDWGPATVTVTDHTKPAEILSALTNASTAARKLGREEGRTGKTYGRGTAVYDQAYEAARIAVRALMNYGRRGAVPAPRDQN